MNPYFTAGLAAEHRDQMMKEASLHRQAAEARAARAPALNRVPRIRRSLAIGRLIRLSRRRVAPAVVA
jgi:hypothetical protein